MGRTRKQQHYKINNIYIHIFRESTVGTWGKYYSGWLISFNSPVFDRSQLIGATLVMRTDLVVPSKKQYASYRGRNLR